MNLFTFFNCAHPLKESFNRFCDDLIPERGPCDLLEGEILRASTQIAYRYYGHRFDDPWFQAHAFLVKHLPDQDAALAILAPYARGLADVTPNAREDVERALVSLLEASTRKAIVGAITGFTQNMEDINDGY